MISRKEQHGDYIFVAVSDTGINHRIHNIPNQDAVDFIVSGDDFALAVSDGVGSCIKAEMGSKAAVTAVKVVFLLIKEIGLQLELSDIVSRIIAEWNRLLLAENLDDCCATLKVAMKFGNKLLLLSIGDGLLAVTSEGMQCSSPIDNCLFTNQTMCLNAAVEAADFWTYEFRLDTYVTYVIFVCSDGVANGIQEGREMELVSEIETDTAAENLQDELETLVVALLDYSSDDRTVGVVKYERKNAKPDR